MVSGRFRLDRRGVGEVLKTQCAGPINALADQIAATVRADIDDDDIPVEVDHYTTDRGAAAVVIADSRGRELQATGGVLTRGAAAAGLEVTSS